MSDRSLARIYRFIRDCPYATDSLLGRIIAGVLWWRLWLLLGLMMASWIVLAMTVGLGKQGMFGWFVGYVFAILSGGIMPESDRRGGEE